MGVTALLLPFGANTPSTAVAEETPPPSVEACVGPTAFKVSTDCYESLLAEGKLPRSQKVIEDVVKNLLESNAQITQLACSLSDRKVDIAGSWLNQGELASTVMPGYLLRKAVTIELLENPHWLIENDLTPVKRPSDDQITTLDALLAPQIQKKLQPGGELWPSLLSAHEVGSILWEGNSGDLLYTKVFAERNEAGDVALRLDPPVNRTGLGGVEPANTNVHTVTCSA